MNFKKWLEAKQPLTPDHVLTSVHKIIPPYRMRNIPYDGEAEVTIYHGGSWPEDPVDEIKPGDWVSLDKAYAQLHSDARGSGKVISKRVPAAHVSWSGTDEKEWFYTPPVANEQPPRYAIKFEGQSVEVTASQIKPMARKLFGGRISWFGFGAKQAKEMRVGQSHEFGDNWRAFTVTRIS